MRVVSTPQGKDSQTSPEAYVSCWINDSDRDNALEKATALIGAHGWSVVEIAEDYSITRDEYSLKPEGLEYYEQALIDGEVLVFFVPKLKVEKEEKGDNVNKPS
jgi:hypothetical protein